MPTARGSSEMYFESAKASGFDLMFIKRETNTENPTLYPPTGPCSVSTLQKRYAGNGEMVDENGKRTKVKGWNMQWFFCFPKVETEDCNKCKCM